MTTLLSKLLGADATHPVFTLDAGATVTAGQIRASAAHAIEALPANGERLYIHTRSAAMFCAGYIAAAALDRQLVLLPQAGSAYRAEVGVPDEAYLTDFDEGGLILSPGGDDADISAGEPKPLIFFTSGSSGKAKEIIKPASAVEVEARSWINWLDGRVTSIAGSVSHQHIYGIIFRLFVPVLAGIPSRDVADLSWEALMEAVDAHTMIVSSPAHLTRLPDVSVTRGIKPELILSSGGPLPRSAADAAAALFGAPPLEILGSSETGGVARRQRVGADEVWTPIEEITASLSDEGELIIASPFTGSKAPVPMGDRAKFHSDGRFELLGRTDRILKVEGKRVSLRRVEDVLKAHDLVADAVILPTQQGERERLSALIVLTEEAQQMLGQIGAFKLSRKLRSDLSDALEPAERPKRWRFVSEIPVNPQGKRVLSSLANLFEGDRILDLLDMKSRHIDGFEAVLEFTLTDDLPWFRGHFDTQGVLPGLAQVHLAVRLTEELWGAGPVNLNVTKMKFRKVMLPGDVVRMTLKFAPDARRLSFSIHRGEEQICSGIVGT